MGWGAKAMEWAKSQFWMPIIGSDANLGASERLGKFRVA